MAVPAHVQEDLTEPGELDRTVRYSPIVRRIERLINLIAALLETEQPMSAEDIRRQIAGYDQGTDEAFRRAFEHDKEALRAMGVPLEVVATDVFTDQADGYLIPKDKYYLPDLDLEPDELAALQIAAQAVLGAQEQAGTGLLKLLVADEGGGVGPGRVSWGADLAAEQPALGPIYSALLERVPISFKYTAVNGPTTKRNVEPYGLVHRRGNWYLVARDRDKGDQRTFRISRVTSEVERGEGTYEIPPDFDAQKHVAREPWESGHEDMTAVVRFDRNMRWWADQNLSMHSLKPGPDGSVDVELDVANPDAFVSWIIEIGGDVEILEPDSLRKLLCKRIAPFLSGSAK